MTLDGALRARLSRLIPPEMLDRLPDTDAIAEVIRRLAGLHKTIGSFIPQYVADDETLQTRSIGRLRPGAFLFADVSGFTALSEHLRARGGDTGAEILTLVINDYFSTMLEILAKSDGQLLKFAGDALLAFFPAGRDDSVPKAIRTGLRMQRAMSKFQPIQTPELIRLTGEQNQRLAMSIGISHGDLFEAYVGNQVQRDHLIQGRLPGDAMDAEGAGAKDDVIIGAALADIAAREFTLSPLEGGFFCVIDDLGDRLDDYEFQILHRRRAKTAAIFDFEVDNLLETLREQLDRVEKVGRFVAPAVLNELVSSGGDHLQSQNRLVVTMFVHVSGFAETLDHWGVDHLPTLTPILERYYSLMQRTVTLHGGSITRSDPYQLGMKLLITFGAPVANPDDPQLAVLAALEMQQQLQQFNRRLREDLPADLRDGIRIVQRAGITLGPVFAGEVGWRARREYTVMGDDVNLSARLMSKAADGQTLVSERVWRRVSGQFEAEPVEPLHLKGKSRPVQAFAITRANPRPAGLSSLSDTPFTGREWEMQRLQALLRDIRSNASIRAVALTGEAGVGKSRLARQLTFLAESAGVQVAWSTCALRGDHNTTWSMLISQLLDLPRHDGNARPALTQKLADLNIEQLEPALADLLFESPDTRDNQTTGNSTGQAPGHTGIFGLPTRTSDEKATPAPGGIFKLAGDQLTGGRPQGEEASGALWQRADQRTSTSETVVQFLAAYTRRCPTLIVIDDLQRENERALGILHRLLAETTPVQLILVLIYEPADLKLAAAPLQIDDLPETEAVMMALRYLHVDSLSDTLRETLWRQARGRPLYIETLLQALRELDQIEISDGQAVLRADGGVLPAPDEVRKIIISRVDRLTPAAQTTLRAASILGDTFTPEALRAVGGITRTDELEAALDELCARQLLEINAGSYRFRHGLTARVVYDSLPRRLRQKLQHTAADESSNADTGR